VRVCGGFVGGETRGAGRSAGTGVLLGELVGAGFAAGGRGWNRPSCELDSPAAGRPWPLSPLAGVGGGSTGCGVGAAVPGFTPDCRGGRSGECAGVPGTGVRTSGTRGPGAGRGVDGLVGGWGRTAGPAGAGCSGCAAGRLPGDGRLVSRSWSRPGVPGRACSSPGTKPAGGCVLAGPLRSASAPEGGPRWSLAGLTGGCGIGAVAGRMGRRS